MNEVEKMYRNCNIKKYRLLDRDNKLKWVYPPFTATKQLELIKWLVKNQDIFKITYHREFLWCSSIEWVESDCYEEFEESLANLINIIWQDLTDTEKAEIKNILESEVRG